MKRIIIFNDGYFCRYFDASTDELLYGACLSIVMERFKGKKYDYLYELKEPESPFDIEILEKIHSKYFSQKAQEELDSYKRSIQNYKHLLEERKVLDKIINEEKDLLKRGKSAKMFLEMQSGREHSDAFQLEFLEDAKL